MQSSSPTSIFKTYIVRITGSLPKQNIIPDGDQATGFTMAFGAQICVSAKRAGSVQRRDRPASCYG